jgi:hypothetical protein
VATGATNRQTAARLILSERTVERHPAGIFAEPEISSRAALAAAVERSRGRRPRPDGLFGTHRQRRLTLLDPRASPSKHHDERCRRREGTRSETLAAS